MRKIKILSITILLIITLGIINTVNGAIAIKEAGSTVLTGKTISEFFDMALQMKDAGQALEGTSLDPHMATNKEWAAVSYLSNSNYGTAGEGKNTGMTVTINGNSHYSTTDNITGVIDWGKSFTFTAGVLANADANITNETVKSNGKSLIDNIQDSYKVDTLDNLGWGSQPEYAGQNYWYGNDSTCSNDYTQPYSIRSGNFSMKVGTGFGSNGPPWSNKSIYMNGAAGTNTFRPVL